MASEAGDDATLSAAEEWRRGWRVVASAFVGNGIGFNLFMMSSGLFVIPIQQELGLSRTAVMISPVASLIVSLLSPLVGGYLDRHGPRSAAIAGFFGLAFSYMLLATLPATPVNYYAVAILFIAAGTVTGAMAFSKGVSLLFHRAAGIAFGVTQSGVSLVSAAVTPMLSLIIATYGWRAGYASCAAMVALIGIPVLFIAFKPPVRNDAAMPTEDRGAARAVARAVARAHLASAQFWILAFSISCGTFCIGGLMSHFYPMLQAGQMTPAAAAAVISTYAVSIGGGRIIVGFLLDRFTPTIVAAGCMALTAFGAALLYLVMAGTLPHGYAFVAAFLLGWGQGAEADFTAFFTLRRFGRRAFATIFSWLNIFAGGFLAIGGLAFAFSYDRLGGYLPAIAAMIALWMLGALSMLFIRLPARG